MIHITENILANFKFNKILILKDSIERKNLYLKEIKFDVATNQYNLDLEIVYDGIYNIQKVKIYLINELTHYFYKEIIV